MMYDLNSLNRLRREELNAVENARKVLSASSFKAVCLERGYRIQMIDKAISAMSVAIEKAEMAEGRWYTPFEKAVYISASKYWTREANLWLKRVDASAEIAAPVSAPVAAPVAATPAAETHNSWLGSKIAAAILRRSRAGAQNIVPNSNVTAKAIRKAKASKKAAMAKIVSGANAGSFDWSNWWANRPLNFEFSGYRPVPVIAAPVIATPVIAPVIAIPTALAAAIKAARDTYKSAKSALSDAMNIHGEGMVGYDTGVSAAMANVQALKDMRESRWSAMISEERCKWQKNWILAKDCLKEALRNAACVKTMQVPEEFARMVDDAKTAVEAAGAKLSALRAEAKALVRASAPVKAVLGRIETDEERYVMSPDLVGDCYWDDLSAEARANRFDREIVYIDDDVVDAMNSAIADIAIGDYKRVAFTDTCGRSYLLGHNDGKAIVGELKVLSEGYEANKAIVITCDADKLAGVNNGLCLNGTIEVEVESNRYENILWVRRYDEIMPQALKDVIVELKGEEAEIEISGLRTRLDGALFQVNHLMKQVAHAESEWAGFRDENGDPIAPAMRRRAERELPSAKRVLDKLCKECEEYFCACAPVTGIDELGNEFVYLNWYTGATVAVLGRTKKAADLNIETKAADEKAVGNIYNKEVMNMNVHDQNQILADLRKQHLEVSENLKREHNPDKVAALKAQLVEIEKAASPLEDASDARFEARANAKKAEANKKAEVERKARESKPKRKASKEEVEAVKAKNFHFVDMATDVAGTEGEDEATKAHVEAIRGRKGYVSTAEKVAYLGDKAREYLDERATYINDLEVEKDKFFKELTDFINRGQKLAFDAAAIRWQYVFMGTEPNPNAAYETRVREGQIAALVAKLFAGAGTEKTLETAKSLLAAVQRAEHDPEFEGISLDSEFAVSEAFDKIQGGMRKYLAAHFHGCYRSLFGLFGTESNGYIQGLDWIMAKDVKDVVMINGLKATTAMKADDSRKIEAIDIRRKALSWALHRKMALIAETHLGLEAKEEKVTSLLYINLGGKAFEDIAALEEALKVESDPKKVAKISANLEKAREAFKVQAAKAFVEIARDEYRGGYDTEYLGKVESREENLNKILNHKLGSGTIIEDLIAIQREEREIQARYRLAVRAIRDKYADTTAKDELDELYQAKLRKYGDYELDVFEAAELEDARYAEMDDTVEGKRQKVKCDRGENAVWNLMTMVNFPKRLDTTWEMIREDAATNGYKAPKNALVWASVNALGLDTTLYNILDVQPKVRELVHSNTFHDVEAFADFVIKAFAVIGQTEEVYDERSGRKVAHSVNIHSEWMKTLAYWGSTLTKERIVQMLTFKLVGDDRLFFEPAGFGDDELTKLDAMSMCAHTSKALPATWLSAIWGRKVPGSWESCLAAENPMDPSAIEGVAYLNEEETSEYLGEGYGIDVNPDHHAVAFTEEYADIRKKNQLLVSDWSDILIFCCQYMLCLATGIEDPIKASKTAKDDLKKAIEEDTEPGLAGTIARRLAEERPEALCERLANGAKVGDMLTEWMPQQMQADINGYPMSKWVVDKVAETFVGNVNRTHNAEFTDWLCAGSDPTESGCQALAKLYAEKQQKDGSETTEAEVKGQKPEDESQKAEAAAWDELNG